MRDAQDMLESCREVGRALGGGGCDALMKFRARTCNHEAAHAVMRYLVGFPMTAISCDDNGEGFSEGTMKPCRPMPSALVLLAGISYEAAFNPFIVNWEKTIFHDLDEVRKILENRPFVRGFVVVSGRTFRVRTVDEAVLHLFGEACSLLRPFSSVIKHVGRNLLLSSDGKLSARSVSATIRESVRREKLDRPDKWQFY